MENEGGAAPEGVSGGRFCGACGARTDARDSFCTSCGQAAERSADPDGNPGVEPNVSPFGNPVVESSVGQMGRAGTKIPSRRPDGRVSTRGPPTRRTPPRRPPD